MFPELSEAYLILVTECPSMCFIAAMTPLLIIVVANAPLKVVSLYDYVCKTISQSEEIERDCQLEQIHVAFVDVNSQRGTTHRVLYWTLRYTYHN